jgi:hypothetical protein
VTRLLEGEDPLLTYPPEPFRMLRELFIKVDELHRELDPAAKTGGIGSAEDLEPVTGSLPQPLKDFLEEQGFLEALLEIRGNSASLPAFRKRFWRWFNMFRIMKFLHFARERGYPDVPVAGAASALLRQMDPSGTGIPSVGSDERKLLLIYRMLDERGSTFSLR